MASVAWIPAEPTEPGDADELVEILDEDPRRICAIVGDLEAARALARKVAGQCGGWYAGPGADARGVPLDGEMPVVVLDGAEARALLGELATRRLHPRLKVIVPCDPATAPELPEAAQVPRGSIMVCVVDGATRVAPSPSPSPSPPPLPEALPADADPAARVAAARARRDKPALEAALRELLAGPDVAGRARAGAALATLTRDVALAEAAVADARRAGAPGLIADALIVLGDLRGGAELRAAYDEAAAVHDADGAIGRAALVRGWSAAFAGDAGDHAAAADLIAGVVETRLALGDAMGAALALGRQARWELERGRPDDARRCAERAAVLSTAIGDPRGLGYATWFLGAIAERRGDGLAAIEYYKASLDAYAELGDVPDRVIAALATLQRAYDGTAADQPEPELPPETLVPLGRRS